MVLDKFDIIEAAIGKAEKDRAMKDKKEMERKRKTPGGGRKIAGRR